MNKLKEIKAKIDKREKILAEEKRNGFKKIIEEKDGYVVIKHKRIKLARKESV